MPSERGPPCQRRSTRGKRRKRGGGPLHNAVEDQASDSGSLILRMKVSGLGFPVSGCATVKLPQGFLIFNRACSTLALVFFSSVALVKEAHGSSLGNLYGTRRLNRNLKRITSLRSKPEKLKSPLLLCLCPQLQQVPEQRTLDFECLTCISETKHQVIKPLGS